MRTSIRIAVAATLVVTIGLAVFGWRRYRDAARLRTQAQQLHARAERGDAEAEAKLGTAYLRGRGVPQDYGESLRWYRKAAEQNSAIGEVGVGAAYYYGYGVPTDYVESMRWYQKAAELGYAAGEAGLGYLYEYGEGVPRDYAEALPWLQKAADQGQRLAEEELGNIYYYGRAVPPNYAEAARWYRKAAEQGYARAQYDVGYMYFYGKGVSRDRTEANRWFAKAADAGDQRAQRMLAPSLSPVIKATLVAQLVGGIFLLSFAPVKLNYFAGSVGWDRDRTVTVAAGLLCIVGVGLRFFGYTHFMLRRLGKPLNSFTCLTWLVEIIMTAALVHVVRIGKSKKPQQPLGRSEIQTEN